jgi:hypothetical protein
VRRPSSAVAVLGFEYGLPRAKRRTIRSSALPGVRLRLYSLHFFRPIAAFAALLSSLFPDFPFARIASKRFIL